MKDRVLRIPAADPGNIVGYEIEVETRPFILQDGWEFRNNTPVRTSARRPQSCLPLTSIAGEELALLAVLLLPRALLCPCLTAGT
jgi:hypothetical protein